MLHSKNIEDVLKQGLRPVRTSDKSLLAISLVTPRGAPLSSYISPSHVEEITITKLKMYSLLALNAYLNEHGDDFEDGDDTTGEGDRAEEEGDDVFGVEVEGVMLWLKGIKGTKFSVVLISEKDYPVGVIRLKLKNLSEVFEELSKFEYNEQE